MLLPIDCLAYRIVPTPSGGGGERLLPAWLSVETDEPFVASVLTNLESLDGLSVEEADMVAPGQLARLTHEHKMPHKVGEALWAIERRRWSTIINAPVDPERLRDVVFELAARMPREEAIALAAEQLAIGAELITGSLFADRRIRRILSRPDARSTASDLIALYNLTLLQSLVARSMEVRVTVQGDPTQVIAAAKRDGLLTDVVETELPNVTAITLLGPLAIFHDTSKYGRSIARFVPSLLAVASAGWSLSARVMVAHRSVAFDVNQNVAIAFATLPAAPDRRLARRVSRTLRAAGIRVDAHPPIERCGASLFAPDFALEWNGYRVCVDVVPFATDEYLACKARAIASMTAPTIVCVDQRFVPPALRGGVTTPWLLPYRQEIDAWALLNAARALVGEPQPISSSSSSSSSSSLASPASS